MGIIERGNRRCGAVKTTVGSVSESMCLIVQMVRGRIVTPLPTCARDNLVRASRKMFTMFVSDLFMSEDVCRT
jgi:hypothetical protein